MKYKNIKISLKESRRSVRRDPIIPMPATKNVIPSAVRYLRRQGFQEGSIEEVPAGTVAAGVDENYDVYFLSLPELLSAVQDYKNDRDMGEGY